MNSVQFLAAVRALNLNSKDYIVIGSGSMCALDIRQADDVDLCVKPDIFYAFEQKDWKKKVFDDDPTYYLTSGIYEVGLDWDSKDGAPNLLDLQKDQFFIEDIPFVSLERLIAWKRWKNQPRHLRDIELIEEYLAKKSSQGLLLR